MVNAKAIGDVVADEDGAPVVLYVIPRNSELPVSVEYTFYTRYDDQTGVSIQIVEERGEPSERVEENTVLHDGHFEFPHPLPSGSPLLHRYALDSTGILHVFLTEPTSGATWEMEVDRHRKVSDTELLQLKPVLARVS
jgi:molecular chaperone DnaK (HSP70)